MNVETITRNLKIYKGVTKAYTVEFYRDLNKSINIEGWTIYFTVKNKMVDSDEDAVINKVITSHDDSKSGKTIITLSSEDTNIERGNYHFSVEYKDDLGNEGVIVYGRLVVEDTVRTERN